MIRTFVEAILREDMGRGDLFERLASPVLASAILTCKESGVFAGVPYVEAVCEVLGIRVTFYVRDGQAIEKGERLALLEGPSTQLLKAERTVLNLAQHASGIATKVATYVRALEGIPVRLLDTRKTRPLLRSFEKYAVRCGGGANHRFGLDDALMLKDTHLALIGNLKETVALARKTLPLTTTIEVECETLEEARMAMETGVDIVMCDNMSLENMEAVVRYKNTYFPHVILEASGNITEATIVAVAQTGVDAVSCGSIIHQATWLDFSMKMKPLH
ncbi:MAG: carboxylating nicotinate-nucleotide diphosphorylase [Campylobacterales bacterium]|nr:carboxylating nicotinate-nucleotide diphosphorylase [Campylobacterales bacterium]